MTVEPERRLIGYARVSTSDQDLSLQREALVKYGVNPDHILEEHASGGRMDRKQLTYALKSMREGDSIVVWKLDRLGRTLTGIIEIVGKMEAEGVNLISTTESIDTTNPMGRTFFHIIAAFAQLERDLISERTKAGMAVAKERGSRFGSRHSIKDNPRRLDAARRIVEAGVENYTADEAVRALNAADPKAKKIKSPETWRRWLRDGCPSLDGELVPEWLEEVRQKTKR